MGFLTIFLMNKLNVRLKILTNKINTVLLHTSQQTYIKDFYRNRIHYNYKSDEKNTENIDS